MTTERLTNLVDDCNFDWKSKPIEMSNYKMDENDYLIGIDENGVTTGIRKNIKKFSKGMQLQNDEKYIGVTCSTIKASQYEDFRNDIISIKQKYWSGYLKNNLEKIVLHFSDIIHGKYPMRMANDKKLELLSDLASLLKKYDISIYTSFIDITKFSHALEWDLYEHTIDTLLRIIGQKFQITNNTFLALIECRDNRTSKDKYTHKCLINSINSTPAVFNNLKGIYFNSKINSNNNKSYAILEMADIIAGAIYLHKMGNNQYDIVYNAIKDKIVVDF